MRKRWILPIVAGCVAGIILLVVFLVSGYAPFGGKSLVVADADIQYLDFFAYFKDVLEGKNEIFYTFSKTLGGNNIAVFSYYLASPLSLMVMLFNKTELPALFDILILVKISLAAVFMTYYLGERFSPEGRRIFAPLLGVTYALSQYPLAQSDNVMWLDAVYLLPLVLLGVYWLVREQKSTLLSISLALAILFNWYTGAIIGIFAVGWFFFECLLDGRRFKVKKFIQLIISMGLGVLISCALFLPTIGALSSGNRAVLELGKLKDWSMIGEIFPGIILKYYPGAESGREKVSLYCGVITVVGIIGSFLSKKITQREKWVFLGGLVVMILMFYWTPLVGLFSLFKSVGSYWSRYSFCGIFIMIFIAARFYFRREPLRIHFGLLVYIVALVLFDAGLNAYLIYEHSSRENVVSYRSYSAEMMEQVAVLKDYDSGVFRVSQTSNRKNNENQQTLTANYNEPLGYNFWSISGYTSSPDDVQRKFLNRAGYRINGENMCITNDAVLGLDALLGVKYTWSKYPIRGLEEITELGEYNGKKAYRNLFAMPLAFRVKEEIEEITESDNPFRYQNELYSQLVGREVEIYKPIKYTEKDGIYKLEIPKGKFGIYANLRWTKEFSDQIKVDEVYRSYARWLAPSVFYVPTEDNNTTAEVTLAEEDAGKIKEAQFYALDLEELAKVSGELQRTPEKMEIRDGYAKFVVTTEEEERLVTTIPADKGWEIKVNGAKVSPELFGETFYVIMLQPGENEVEMVYHPLYLKLGIAISLVGIMGTVSMYFLERGLKKGEKCDRI